MKVGFKIILYTIDHVTQNARTKTHHLQYIPLTNLLKCLGLYTKAHRKILVHCNLMIVTGEPMSSKLLPSWYYVIYFFFQDSLPLDGHLVRLEGVGNEPMS